MRIGGVRLACGVGAAFAIAACAIEEFGIADATTRGGHASQAQGGTGAGGEGGRGGVGGAAGAGGGAAGSDAGPAGPPCAKAIDCFPDDCVEGHCAERAECAAADFSRSHLACTVDQDCGGFLSCQEVGGAVPFNTTWACLQRAGCEAGGEAFSPCCTAGEVCGAVTGFSGVLGVACCRPGERLGETSTPVGIAIDTLCQPAAGRYACAKDHDCAGIWTMVHCRVDEPGALGHCVECASASDCKDPARRACVDEACVECGGDGDCAGGPLKRCKVDEHRCVQCLGGGDCAAPTPVCSPSSTCTAS